MRPLSIAERQIDSPSVSLAAMFEGSASIKGSTGVTLKHYVREIVSSGFPGIRALPPRLRRTQLDSYIAGVIDIEFAELGQRVRRRQTLFGWMRSYAAATGTTASYASILDAATPAQSDKPAKTTTIVYRDVLSQLWLLDQVEPWALHRNDFARLAQSPKHFLADPALAVRLLGLDKEQLMAGAQVRHFGPQQGTLVGRLFEALVALSLQTYARASELTVSHLRTVRGEHEIDFIIHGGARNCVGVEVKLANSVTDSDVKHLLWLKRSLGDDLRDMAIIYTGASAYRRRDGVAVISAALLGS